MTVEEKFLCYLQVLEAGIPFFKRNKADNTSATNESKPRRNVPPPRFSLQNEGHVIRGDENSMVAD